MAAPGAGSRGSVTFSHQVADNSVGPVNVRDGPQNAACASAERKRSCLLQRRQGKRIIHCHDLINNIKFFCFVFLRNNIFFGDFMYTLLC